MLHVCFIIHSQQLPSSRVRVLNHVAELEKHGIYANVIEFPKNYSDRIRLYLACRCFDLVVIQKILFSGFDLFLLRHFSKKLAFDFDDAIYYRQDRHTENTSRYRKFINIISSVDLVIAGNRVLAQQSRRFNSNVSVLPSAVKTRNIPVKNYQFCPGEKTIIGWVGTEMTLPYLALLGPALQQLAQHYPIELRIICSKSIEIEGVPVHFIPWSLDTQEKEIAQFDIGIMPLPDTGHAQGKCGYKALQYMAAGVPPVVSDVGINHEIVAHGETGLVCDNIDDFYGALETLIKNPSLRHTMGDKARQQVENEYSIHVVAEKLARLLLSQ